MKQILTLLLLACNSLFAQYNPNMRINFGGSSAIVRLQTGYFVNPIGKTAQTNENNTQKQSMLSSMRIGFESMFIINNRGRFSESVSRNASKFIVLRVNHDGFKSSTLSSVSIATALKCRTSIPFFGQVKGYWSIGAALRNNGIQNPEILEAKNMLGGRLAFNIYNKKSALQAEVCGFANKAIVNVVVYKKLSPHILISTGYEYEQAVAGLSALIGSCRITASTRISQNKRLQHGISFIANL
jgi:hypothetical protein